MADPKWQDQQVLTEKVTAYLETHQKITADFERSLQNARHFVELAKISTDKEPAETVTMLEQIQEIDLLGHLQAQLDAFEEISGLLDKDEELELEESGEMDRKQEIRNRYDLMLEEAEDQQNTIAELILYLRNRV